MRSKLRFKAFVRAKAVLMLHTIRLWRYKWSFLNMILAEAAWIFLFVLGALLFVPKEQLGSAVKVSFWILAAWSLISNFSSLIGGWMSFFISIGMVEEHLLRGFSPFKALLGRIITGSSVMFASLLFMALLVRGAFHVNLLSIKSPLLTFIGIILLALESISYGFSVAAISMRTSIPNFLLEILNLGMIGLMMIPLSSIPGRVRLLYLCIPYMAPAYLIKLSVLKDSDYMVKEAVLISLTIMALMLTVALAFMKYVDRWVRKNGVKAVGFW